MVIGRSCSTSVSEIVLGRFGLNATFFLILSGAGFRPSGSDGVRVCEGLSGVKMGVVGEDMTEDDAEAFEKIESTDDRMLKDEEQVESRVLRRIAKMIFGSAENAAYWRYDCAFS